MRRLPRRYRERGFALVACAALVGNAAAAQDCVVLLHGLARGAGSMSVMAEALAAAGAYTS
ncbi:MAG: hypothetical protein CME59_07800 [Halioglobus sp.]|nr:hypothetical protein [Halioglobus sp.]